MFKLLIACLVVLAFNAQAETEVKQISELTSYIVTSTSGNTGPKYSESQVAEMLNAGNTCVKDGGKVLFKSKNITKKHCQKAKYLPNIRVIKASDTSFYTKLLGL